MRSLLWTSQHTDTHAALAALRPKCLCIVKAKLTQTSAEKWGQKPGLRNQRDDPAHQSHVNLGIALASLLSCVLDDLQGVKAKTYGQA